MPRAGVLKECGRLLVAVALVYAVAFACTGASWIWPDQFQAFQIYAGRLDPSALPPLAGFNLEGIIPDYVGAAVLPLTRTGTPTMIAYQILGFAFLFGVLCIGLIRRQIGVLSGAVLVALGEVAKVNLAWLMKPDVFTMGFLLLAVWSVESPLVALWLFLAALCHPALAVLGAGALIVGRIVLRGLPTSLRGWLPLAAAAVGALAGYVLDGWYVAHRFPGIQGRGEVARLIFPAVFSNGFPDTVMFAALSLAFPAAVVVLACLGGATITFAGRDKVLLAICFAGLLCTALFVAFDHTRIFVVGSLPLVALGVVRWSDEIETAVRRYRGPLLFALLVVSAVPQLDMDGWRGFTFPHFDVLKVKVESALKRVLR